jgi:tetratricopeptide (TPR) repeat protein
MEWNDIKTAILADSRGAIDDLIESPDFLNSEEQVLFKAASLLRKKRYYTESIRIIEILESSLRGDALINARYFKADACLDAEKYQDAVACYSTILADQETDIAYNNRGLAYWSLHHYEEALTDYKRAVELNPGNAVAYRGAGEMYLKLGLADEAIRYFKIAIKVDQDYVDALVGLGVAFYQTGQWAKSYEALLAAKVLDPLNDLANRGIRKIDHYFDSGE